MRVRNGLMMTRVSGSEWRVLRTPARRLTAFFSRLPIPNSRFPQHGITFLGIIVAIGAVVLVTGALAGLAQRGTQASLVTRERVTATFLAREAIELVRAIRDNNWLATPRCPDFGACTIFWRGQTTGAGALCNGTFRVDAATMASAGLVATTAASADTRLTRAGTVYGHEGGSTTPFRRWVEITSSEQGCGESSVFVRTPAPTPLPVGPSPTPAPTLLPTPDMPQPMTIRAIVEWTTSGGTRRAELQEILYPWLTVR